MTPSPVSVIVPTYREADNIHPLVTRIADALRATGRDFEIILIDDNSQDGTVEAAETLRAGFPVRLVVRTHDKGLSSAVIRGFQEARYDQFVVLDADLQHPPEAIPGLLDSLDENDTDFVIATRHAGAGSIAGDWPRLRRWGSQLAALLARPLVPLSDPMSGFFALHRRTWAQAAPLSPIGYKIAIELYVKGGCHRPAEVPIHFATRAAGTSKAGLKVQLAYLAHLWALYRFRFPRVTSLVIGVILVIALAIGVIIVQLAG